ncbi:MAG TPA: hypothetical protein VFT31_15490 [Kribbella sp.]|nr:hypothetical protein [Kribbella sp.]
MAVLNVPKPNRVGQRRPAYITLTVGRAEDGGARVAPRCRTSRLSCRHDRAALSRGYDLTLVEDGRSTPAPAPESGVSVDAIVARYNQVLSWADYPDRDVTVTPAADVTFG